MKVFKFLGVLALMMVASTYQASAANIRVVIDKSEQTMRVMKDGTLLYRWPVSTGTTDRRTPNGTFRVQSFSENHRSSRYGGAPMPHSIFFNGHIAAHGTTEEHRLGSRASHGCVRLSRENARTLFMLVRQHAAGTRFIVQS